ncbi:uncharacterized protein DSM5745_10040 [Aspergillus mulundensis]|uniref:Uncharacterized protein n=1 Tax=Aspergillus mulundensis TaxID=1810919 RepID=A0A3D8QMA4_9EURO|nr:Uncharacterized protein DSM5745_10040 [Aspergillus mulundensis]RDW62929.1 Uncharacterized protein DSM5745_10040 [Aspergillus mulundensis]
MQRIWSRSAPATPSSLCISCLKTAAEGLASRTASTAGERSVPIENPVATRYTSTIATAVSRNARGKSRCRREREEIALDEDESHDLRAAGHRASSAAPLRQSTVVARKALQKRSFHTLPRPVHQNDRLPKAQAPRRYMQFWTTKNHKIGETAIIKKLEAENADSMKDDDDFDMALDVEELPEWLTADQVCAKAIKKLALKQLAIRLLIRPSVAHSYFGVLKNYGDNDDTPQLDLPGLLFELNAVRRRIGQIKANPKVNIDDLVGSFNSPRWQDLVRSSNELEKKMRQDSNQYLSGQMPLEEFLLRLSDGLLRCHDPDRQFVFTYMIIAFTHTRQNDLAQLVIKTILPYQFEMSVSLILAILNFFRKTKDLKGFDLFLLMLEGKGYPINMGKLSLFVPRTINGLRITVPPVHSANIVLYGSLIRACLRFDQPDRADAYLLAARAAGYMDDFAILMAYLEFYTIRKDWERGRQALQRALAYITSTTMHPYTGVGRLIVMMVQLSDECRKFDVSEALIKAAVQSGFSADLPSRQSDIVSEADPDHYRWTAAAQETPPATSTPLAEKCHAFANIIREQLEILAPTGESSADRLQRLMGTYSEQLMSTVLDEGLALKASRKPLQTEQADKVSQTEMVEQEKELEPQSSPEDIMAAQQNEMRALKSEVAFLKHLVLRMAAQNTLSSAQGNKSKMANTSTLESPETLLPESAEPSSEGK